MIKLIFFNMLMLLCSAPAFGGWSSDKPDDVKLVKTLMLPLRQHDPKSFYATLHKPGTILSVNDLRRLKRASNQYLDNLDKRIAEKNPYFFYRDNELSKRWLGWGTLTGGWVFLLGNLHHACSSFKSVEQCSARYPYCDQDKREEFLHCLGYTLLWYLAMHAYVIQQEISTAKAEQKLKDERVAQIGIRNHLKNYNRDRQLMGR
jgi:hypothetical protein